VWALSRLLSLEEFEKLRREDSSESVNEEWGAAIS
jgi:hypothetical protein